ncbi:hypothetical protein [uncultured Sutterella sp.]|uniref:hypothetical protein n=1 Tax=uncultured Sutterella sp. TaxID=286133 RepID=UPI00260162FF|nr:hypothetical protein [uncultured Sutterella sp.]
MEDDYMNTSPTIQCILLTFTNPEKSRKRSPEKKMQSPDKVKPGSGSVRCRACLPVRVPEVF